jgi:hypothetical protein
MMPTDRPFAPTWGSTSSSAVQWKQSGYEKFIVAARQWSNEPGSRTTMLLSPHPWPTNAGGKPDTFVAFTADTCRGDTRVFVEPLREEHAIASAWEVDYYEGLDPHHAPAVAPENAPNATTEVGLRLAKHAPVDVPREGERNAICSPQAN